MAVLMQKIRLKGSKGEQDVEALFDTGATYSFIKKKIAEKIAYIESLPESISFSTASKDKQIIIDTHISVFFYLDGFRFSDEFLVSDEITEDVIIGDSTMQKWRFKLDLETERVVFDPKVTRMIII